MSVFAVGCGGGAADEEKPAADADTSLTDLQDKGTMVVGIDDQFRPMGFVGEDGNSPDLMLNSQNWLQRNSALKQKFSRSIGLQRKWN